MLFARMILRYAVYIYDEWDVSFCKRHRLWCFCISPLFPSLHFSCFPSIHNNRLLFSLPLMRKDTFSYFSPTLKGCKGIIIASLTSAREPTLILSHVSVFFLASSKVVSSRCYINTMNSVTMHIPQFNHLWTYYSTENDRIPIIV